MYFDVVQYPFKNQKVKRGFFCAVKLFILLSILAKGYAQQSDSLDRFSVYQLIAPATLFTIGAIGVNNGWICKMKTDVRDSFQTLRGDHRFPIDDFAQYAPLAAQVGLGLVGVEGRHPFRERMLATATACISMGILVNGIKYTVREPRPDTGTRNSFPSGHTAMAFVGAELVREEYGNGWGLGAYILVASGTALMRLYNNRHWLNDIIAGASVGILSARIGYWLLPCERRWLGWDKVEGTVAVVPAYNVAIGSTMPAIQVSFALK